MSENTQKDMEKNVQEENVQETLVTEEKKETAQEEKKEKKRCPECMCIEWNHVGNWVYFVYLFVVTKNIGCIEGTSTSHAHYYGRFQ